MCVRRFGISIMGVCALAVSSLAFAASPVLLRGDGVEITAEEFENFAKVAVPPEQMSEFYKNEQRGRELLGEYYVMLKLAKEAEDNGLDKQVRIAEALRQGRVRLLAQERLNQVASEAKAPDYEMLAKEEYISSPEKYRTPERISVAHVLVAVNAKRTEADALARAKDVLKKAQAGEDFRKLAEEYSDDPSAAKNKGDLGYFAAGQMVKPFEEAAFAMTKPGQLSEPVKTQFGYHILRFEGRQPSKKLSFDEVKAELVEEQKARVVGEVKSAKIGEVRSDKNIVVDQKAVSAFFNRK